MVEQRFPLALALIDRLGIAGALGGIRYILYLRPLVSRFRNAIRPPIGTGIMVCDDGRQGFALLAMIETSGAQGRAHDQPVIGQAIWGMPWRVVIVSQA